jgi:hypothetical protein
MANATSSVRTDGLPVGGAPDAGGDWPAQAADTIERVVGTVRDKTTGPAITVSRGVVYGAFATIVGVAALFMLIIGLVRIIDNYLPDAWFGEDHMWATYLVLGLPCVIGGLILWTRRRPGREEA